MYNNNNNNSASPSPSPPRHNSNNTNLEMSPLRSRSSNSNGHNNTRRPHAQQQQHAISSSSSSYFERLPSSMQFAVLVLGVFCFFGLHNLLQEAIMEIMQRQYGVMLGYTEVLGVSFFSYVERECVVRERGRVAPLSFYPLLTLCLLGSSALSNIALNYINFPTKVVFRSSKLIPTMLIASIMHAKVFTWVEYTCAIAISMGLILFAAADWELAPTFHPIGLLLVTLSVFSDAILPNAQERLFGLGASRLEVTLYTNIFALLAYTVTTYASGDLTGALALVLQDRRLAIYYCVYTVVAYFAISMHMNVVKRFGGVAAVLVATGRKGMTLILSFLLFPKAFSWYYPIGANLVLGGLLVASLHKLRRNNNNTTTTNKPKTMTPSAASASRTLKHHQSDDALAPAMSHMEEGARGGGGGGPMAGNNSNG